MKPLLHKFNSKQTSPQLHSRLNLFLTFFAMFVFGLLFLMVGYTQNFVKYLIWPGSNNPDQKYISLLLLPQMLGIVLGTIVVGKLISRYNIRYLYIAGLGSAGIILFIIGFMDKFNLSQNSLIAVYSILTLIFGMGVGPISPLVVMYIAAKYKDDTSRNRMVSSVNAVYGLGAGIIPLALAGVIVNQTAGTNLSFANGRYFYIIAACISLLGAATSSLINFKHSQQLTSSVVIGQEAFENKDKKKIAKNLIRKPLIVFLFMIVSYMIVETSINFSFTNFGVTSTASHISHKDLQIEVTRAFGMYICIQGLWRMFSGIFLLSRVKYPVFITASIIGILIGLIGIFAGALNTIYGIYLEAAVFGFGIGNLYPAIYSYGVSIDNRRATFLGKWLSIGQMSGLLLGQLFIGILWLSAENATNGSVKFFAPIIFITCISVLLMTITLTSINYIKNSRKRLEA